MASIPVVGMAGSGFQEGLCRTWRWIRILGFIYLCGCAVYLLLTLQAFTGALPEVKVPLVVGVEQGRATADLEKLGFIVHVDAVEPADGFPAGAVMYQSLHPDAHVREGRSIYLVICQGPAHVVLPDLRQSANYDAMRALAQLGLQPSIASTAHSSAVSFDSVIEQIPAPGTRVEVGSAVALIVSDGPPDDYPGGDSPLSAGDTSSGDMASVPRPRHHEPTDKDPSKADKDGSKSKDPTQPGDTGAAPIDPTMPDIPPMPKIDASGNIIDPSIPAADKIGNTIPGDTSPLSSNSIPDDTTARPPTPAPRPGRPSHEGSRRRPTAPTPRTPAARPRGPVNPSPVDTTPLPMTPADPNWPR
ncbi:MAG: PASTA domain-containing protein [Armatimonadota bacterium]|nr:PASTA domain-containing protein [Armatimonadota bacterium]